MFKTKQNKKKKKGKLKGKQGLKLSSRSIRY